MKKLLILAIGLISASVFAQPASKMFKADVYDFNPGQDIFDIEDTKARNGKKMVSFAAKAHVFNCSQVFDKKINTKVSKCTDDKLYLTMNYNVRARFSGHPQEGYRTSLLCLNPRNEEQTKKFKVVVPKDCNFSNSSGGEIVINTYSKEIAEKYAQMEAEHEVCEDNLVTDLPSYYFNECDKIRKDTYEAIDEERKNLIK